MSRAALLAACRNCAGRLGICQLAGVNTWQAAVLHHEQQRRMACRSQQHAGLQSSLLQPAAVSLKAAVAALALPQLLKLVLITSSWRDSYAAAATISAARRNGYHSSFLIYRDSSSSSGNPVMQQQQQWQPRHARNSTTAAARNYACCFVNSATDHSTSIVMFPPLCR